MPRRPVVFATTAISPDKASGMSKTVSDFFWERLSAWGVKRIFGYPGDGINA
jgi:hypothetical protein